MIEGQEGVTWEHWCALADACEEHGVETLFRSDHYISQADEDGNVAHDAWTTIAALAARTTTLRFGTLVSPATFRPAGAARQRGRDRRSRLGRADRARSRRRLDGARAPRLRLSVPRDARAAGDVRRAARDRPPALDGGARRLPRRALHARGRARPPEARPAAASAAARRRQRHARDCRARRALRGRVQHAVRVAGGLRRDPRQGGSRVRAHRPRSRDDALLDDDRLPDRLDARRGARAGTRALRARATGHKLRRVGRCVRATRRDRLRRRGRGPPARVRAGGLRARDAAAPPAHRSRAGAADRPRARARARL